MPLNLSKRAGQLGVLLNIQPKMIREDRFARFGIPVVGVEVSAEEYGQILLNEKAIKHFWKRFKGRDPELAYPMLGAQTLAKSIRDCTVNLWLQDRIMRLTAVTLVKSRFTLLSKSVVWSFTIQAMPQLNDLVEALLATLGQPVLIEIDCPTWGAQQDLPLEEEDKDDEQEPQGDAASDKPEKDNHTSDERSGIHRQIEASETKKRARAAKKKTAE